MKTAIKNFVFILVLVSMVSCANTTPQVLDGDGMLYNDADYRTEYANALNFDSVEGTPYWAVAFLGYGDVGRDMRETYVLNAFDTLSEESINKVEHFQFDGDEWYLIVPRYKDDNVIKNIDADEQHIVHNGSAFTVKCNLSDIHSNIEISVDAHGGHKFSPQVDGTGKLAVNDEIWDITDSVLPVLEQ